jgi:1-acyl-sn-glycerol-3-phosphate acyltransferase
VTYAILRVVARAIASLTTRLEVEGLERLPDGPPYILVTNHLSVFDLPLLLFVLPHRIRAFAASKHRSNPLYGPLLEIADTIWVRRGEIDRQALRKAMAVLERGEAVGVAPEGTRSKETHALQRAKAGAAYIATRADVPIVPAGITGTEKISHGLRRLRRPRVRIIFGEPFRLPEAGHVRSQKLQEYTDLIMHRIAALLPEVYRGVYR